MKKGVSCVVNALCCSLAQRLYISPSKSSHIESRRPSLASSENGGGSAGSISRGKMWRGSTKAGRLSAHGAGLNDLAKIVWALWRGEVEKFVSNDVYYSKFAVMWIVTEKLRCCTYQEFFVDIEHLLRLDDVGYVVRSLERVLNAQSFVLGPPVGF